MNEVHVEKMSEGFSMPEEKLKLLLQQGWVLYAIDHGEEFGSGEGTPLKKYVFYRIGGK